MKTFMKAIAAIMLMTAIVCAAGCNKPDNPNNGGGNDSLAVKVTTYTPEQIAQSSAVCGGEVTEWNEEVEIEELGVCWSKNSNPQMTDNHLSTMNWEEPFVCVLTDLELETKYYVRAFAKAGADLFYGEVKTFTTLPALNGPSVPSVFTLFVTDVHSNYAIGNGYVAGNGGSIVTERGFCWSSSTSNPTIANNHIANGSGLGQYAVAMTGLSPNTIYYACAYAINSVGIDYGIVVCFETNNEGGYDNPDWVDLGLPSGLLWATRNVGATKPEDYGNYFAWGETQTKTINNWETYKYGYIDGDDIKITKYNTKPSYGNVDNLTILLPEDDAATISWGDGARIPTYFDWVELYNSCTRTYSTINGTIGLCFTGTNGNTLFLPSSQYWSSSLLTLSPSDAWGFVADLEDDYPIHNYQRCYDQAVRPVRSMR